MCRTSITLHCMAALPCPLSCLIYNLYLIHLKDAFTVHSPSFVLVLPSCCTWMCFIMFYNQQWSTCDCFFSWPVWPLLAACFLMKAADAEAHIILHTSMCIALCRKLSGFIRLVKWFQQKGSSKRFTLSIDGIRHNVAQQRDEKKHLDTEEGSYFCLLLSHWWVFFNPFCCFLLCATHSSLDCWEVHRCECVVKDQWIEPVTSKLFALLTSSDEGQFLKKPNHSAEVFDAVCMRLAAEEIN